MKRTAYPGAPAAWSPNTGTWMRATVLLVDSDLGFVFWLGQTLDFAGYCAIPAKSTLTAKELVNFHKVTADILIIDPSLPDVVPFISALRNLQPIKVIGCVDVEGREYMYTSDFDLIKAKPKVFTDSACAQWMEIVESLLLVL
jgi:hypothetical protein